MPAVKYIPIGAEPKGLWKDIPGFKGYQASVNGEIRKVKNGKYFILSPYFATRRRTKAVHMINDQGNRCEKHVQVAVWTAFNGMYDTNKYCIVHRNKVMHDNALVNLRLVTRTEMQKFYGGRHTRICVLKYDPETLECVDSYVSANEAARKNYISLRSVIVRCNAKCIQSPAADGYEYCWDDPESIKWMMKRIKGQVTSKEYHRFLETPANEIFMKCKYRKDDD